MSFEQVFRLVGSGQVAEGVRVLGGLPSESIPLERIRPWVFHADAGLRQLVVRILGRRCDVDSIWDLAKLYEASLDFYDHDFIFEAFVAMGSAGVPGLTTVVREGTTEQRSAALQGLGQIGGAALPELLTLFESGLVDDSLFRALSNSYDARAVPSLLRYLSENPDHVEAADALSNCSDESCGDSVAGMTEILKQSRSREVRLSLIEAIGATRSIEAIAPLSGHLRAAEAVEALGHIADPEALQVLVGALELPLKTDCRDSLLTALLTHPLAGEDLRRRVARLALGRPDLEKTLEAVVGDPVCQIEVEEFARCEDPHFRLALANVLEAGKAAVHYEYLSRLDDNRIQRQLASRADRLPDSIVLTLSRHPDSEVRRQLALALRFCDKVPEVLDSLLVDRRAKVRQAAVEALEETRESLVRLRDMALDRSVSVRSAAVCKILTVPDLAPEEILELLQPYLYDRTGRPTDPPVGNIFFFEGCNERPYLLSQAIAELDHPLANQVLERWRQCSF